MAKKTETISLPVNLTAEITFMNRLTVGSLFSGIGGFDLGLERAGFEIKWQVEIDEFCKKILSKHWQNVPKFSDIKNCGSHNLETVDLICGGFPCQPFSIAGKRRGNKDDRYLWSEMFRIIKEIKPSWVIGENVTGIINMALEQVCVDLEAEGYDVQPLIIPACAVNAPHRRDRVWILANNTQKDKSEWEGWQCGIGEDSTNATDTTSGRLQRSFEANNQQGAQSNDKQFAGCCREWNEDWYEVATRFCRVSHGIPNRIHRLRSLGNSIVPQIAEILGEMILKCNSSDTNLTRSEPKHTG